MQFNFLNPEILTRGNARVFPYQHTARLVHGPQEAPKFRARKWVFRVQSSHPHRITMHHFDSEANKQHAMNEIEFFFRSALDQCVRDGALPTDIIHLYLECDGMDFTFVHNPAGPFAISLQQLLEPNGLHIILERFAQMIQSGRNISLDNNTRLTICSYSPIQGGALQALHNTKESFVRNSTSIVRIANEGDEMCFAYAKYCSCTCKTAT